MLRRLFAVVAIVAVLGAVLWGSNSSAQDDAVPLLQTQVADLQTRVAALEGTNVATPETGGITSTVSASYKWRITGTGQQVNEPFTVGDVSHLGLLLDCVTNDGWMVLRNESYPDTQRLDAGETIVEVVPQNTYSVNVHCGGRWQLVITYWQ